MALALIDLPGAPLEAATAALRGAWALVLDVTDTSAVAKATAMVAAGLPPVCYLFNNAGMAMPSTALADRHA